MLLGSSFTIRVFVFLLISSNVKINNDIVNKTDHVCVICSIYLFCISGWLNKMLT